MLYLLFVLIGCMSMIPERGMYKHTFVFQIDGKKKIRHKYKDLLFRNKNVSKLKVILHLHRVGNCWD